MQGYPERNRYVSIKFDRKCEDANQLSFMKFSGKTMISLTKSIVLMKFHRKSEDVLNEISIYNDS